MSLLVWLPLNGNTENQGLASDIKIVGGTATVDNDGKIGQCYSFTKASNQYLMGAPAPLNNDMNEWSYACWFKPTDVHNGCLLSNRTTTNTTGIALFYYNNNQFLFDDGTRWQFTPTIRITPGVWNHIVCVRKKDVGKYLYVNGVLSNSTTTTGTPAIATSPYFSIGNSQNGNTSTSVGGNPLNGLLNDVRIYDHALSKKEIEELSKGLIVHYKLDDPYIEPTSNFLYGKTLAGHGSQWTLQTEKLNNYPIYKNVVNNPNTGNNAGFRYTTSEPITLTSNKVTISFWKRLNTVYGKNLGGYIRFKDASNNNINGSWVYNKSNWANDANSIGKWEYITATATINNYTNATSFNCFYIYVDNAPSGDCDFSQIQIEFKDHATPYTESNRTWFIEDCSGYLKHGTLVDNTIQASNATKRYSYCLKNNVAANVSTYPFYGECNIPPSDQLTFTWWMNLTQWGHQNSGLFSTSNTTAATDYNTTAANMRDSGFDTCDTDGNVVRLTNIPSGVTINEWHQYALIYNGTKLSFYKDGIEQRSVNRTGTLKAFKYIIPFYSCAGGSRRSCSGYLSDFRIYVTALTVDQLKELYNVSVAIDKNGNVYPRELVEE